MTIIDAHVHMGPGLANHTSRPILAAETADQLIAVMDRASINQACTFAPLLEGGGFDDYEYQAANRAVYEAWKRYPTRIIGFCRVNPNLGKQPLEEMRRCKEEYGFRGLKLHPDWEYFYIHGRTPRPVLDRAAEYGWPVFLHTGYYPLSHPTLALPLAEAYPTVNLILGHLSYRHTADAIIVAERCPNIYLETSGNSTAQAIQEVLVRVGAAKLVYGSDIPYTLPEDVLEKIRRQPRLKEEERGMVLGATMGRLLGQQP